MLTVRLWLIARRHYRPVKTKGSAHAASTSGSCRGRVPHRPAARRGRTRLRAPDRGSGEYRRRRLGCLFGAGNCVVGRAAAPPTAGRSPHRAPGPCLSEGGAGRPPLPREQQAPELAAFTCTFMASAPRTSPPSTSATATTGKPAAPPVRPITTADGGEPVTGRGAGCTGSPGHAEGASTARPTRGQRAPRPRAVLNGTNGKPHCLTHRVISSSRPCVPHVWPG